EKTLSNIFLLDLNSAIALFKEDKITAEDVINSYQTAIAMFEKMEQNDDNAKAKADLEGLFIGSKVASCENLISLFTPRLEAAPEDMDLITNIVKMMGSTDGCQNNELFLKAVTTMHNNQPSSNSAYYLYKLHAAKSNSELAAKYLEEAIASEDIEESAKADYQLELATYCVKNGMTGKGFEAAKKAAEISPANAGKAYYLIGTIWGSTRCGGNEVTSRANYWVAIDYLQKAKAADPSLADDCNSLIGSYSVYFPQKADAFMYDLSEGQSYTVNCGGMHATTTVRTQK
ncbi:MAG: tetratricopeptide repeat protein, partial [Candidatus Cryptobacteroides sp.]